MHCKAYKIQLFSLVLVLFMYLGMGMTQKSYAQNTQTAQETSPEINNPAFSVTGLPIPRFVSLSSDKIFMRTGPGQKYPLLWQYNRKNLPVEIIMEFDVWRKIRDVEGAEGWVHKSLLSGKRFVIARSDEMIPVYNRPQSDGRLMAYIESNAIGSLETCEPEWCEIKAQGYSGWVQRKFLWGVYDTEQFN